MYLCIDKGVYVRIYIYTHDIYICPANSHLPGAIVAQDLNIHRHGWARVSDASAQSSHVKIQEKWECTQHGRHGTS